MRTPRRTTAAGIAVVLVAAGAAIALLPFEAVDSYCGRPLWDASWEPPCDGRMAASTVAAAALLAPRRAAGVAALVAAAATTGAAVAAAVARRRR